MSSAAPSTVVIKSGPVVYDSNVKMGALRRIIKASTNGDLEALIEGFTRIVISWPFPGDPTTIEAWDELGRDEFGELITAISQEFSRAGEA